jgi:hypothetical protein
MTNDIDKTDWSPERKVVGAAVAVVVTGALVHFTGFDAFPGFEGAVAVLVAYFLPSEKRA